MRCEMVDSLSGYDDELANEVIQSGSLKGISGDIIRQAIRKCTSDRSIVPVFLGSAYKNIGVQPLLDGIVSFLPAPSHRSQQYKVLGFVFFALSSYHTDQSYFPLNFQ